MSTPRTRPILLALGGTAAALLLLAGPRRPEEPGSAPPGPAVHAAEGECRLWGLTGPAPTGLAADHLSAGTWNNFKLLSSFHRDGWGLAAVLPDSGACALRLPLVRRGGVAAGNPYDPDFDLAIAEIDELHPSAVVAHIRKASSGVTGIPDPHPFTREGFVFAHNGLINLVELLELLTSDDPQYLVTHPPAYNGAYIDSELYLLWLLKYRHQHPAMPMLDALVHAASVLYARVAPQRLNFVLTRGDTLWACRCAGDDANDPLRFFPAAPEPPSPFWIVCSTVVGSDSSGWGTFPPLSVGQFVPGRVPVFIPLLAPTSVGEPRDEPAGDAFGVAGGRAASPWPNPGGGPFLVPIPAREPVALASLQVWNAAGALVWEDAVARPIVGSGEPALLWPGTDRGGRAAPPGVYLCRVRAGERQAEHKITVVR